MESVIRNYLDRLAALESQDLIFLSGAAVAAQKKEMGLSSCLTKEAGGLLFDLAILLGAQISEYVALPQEVGEIIRTAKLRLEEPEGVDSEAELVGNNLASAL